MSKRERLSFGSLSLLDIVGILVNPWANIVRGRINSISNIYLTAKKVSIIVKIGVVFYKNNKKYRKLIAKADLQFGKQAARVFSVIVW